MRVIAGKATAPNGLEAERYLAGRTDSNGVAYIFRNYRDIVGAHPLGITIAKLDPTVTWVRREGKCAVGVGESSVLVPVSTTKSDGKNEWIQISCVGTLAHSKTSHKVYSIMSKSHDIR